MPELQAAIYVQYEKEATRPSLDRCISMHSFELLMDPL